MNRPADSNTDIIAWSDYLKDLLDRAKAASGADDGAQIKKVQTELGEYDRHSPPAAGALDQIAREAFADLFIQDLHTRAEALKSRDAEYAQIKQLIDGVIPKKTKK